MTNKHPLWQPSASIAILQKRAQILADIRSFFAKRQVMEVDTPLLASKPVTDPHLVNFSCQFVSPISAVQQTLYLQTSPEYAMKRLLCAGSGDIYQLGKAFRNEEAGRHHNPEFTLLEWYRLDFDHWQLMEEVADLLALVLGCIKVDKVSYASLFRQYLGIDPLDTGLAHLQQACIQQGFADLAQRESNKDTLLQLLFSHVIEPQIGQAQPCFVYHFPASQAALAKISQQDKRVAERFEVYYQGIELANGFHELQSAQEQRYRFEQDNLLRQQMGLAQVPIDESLLAALEKGLPACAGVALGFDRLLMLACSLETISEGMPFSITHA